MKRNSNNDFSIGFGPVRNVAVDGGVRVLYNRALSDHSVAANYTVVYLATKLNISLLIFYLHVLHYYRIYYLHIFTDPAPIANTGAPHSQGSVSFCRLRN
jgi:hypothetical protein